MKAVTIENLNHQGLGIASINGKKVFIKNALPNEKVEIKIIKENKNYIEAQATNILTKSPTRIEPKCKYYSECGGCNLMHLNYETQLNFKKDKVKNIFEKYAKIKINPNIIESKNIFNYRNKITLHSKNNKIGFYKNNSNDIIEIKECLIAKYKINKELNNITTSKEDIIIKVNKKEKIITSNSKDNSFIEELNGFKYKVDINSFFQINHEVCEELINYVMSNIKNSKNALDLYSGIGTFTLPLSKKSKKVTAIEINKFSYNNAIINKELNNISNIKLIKGKVEEVIYQLEDNYDTIIMDPSRSGIKEKVINFILNKLPKNIIYISCEPITLARDINKLKEKYEIKEIKLFDMFPQTFHIETIAVLNLK